MKWSVFKTGVDELLAVERRRLGAQPFIDRQVRLAIGHVQRLISYYRKGIVSTYEIDDVQKDGFASRGVLPRGASIREIYHIKVGSLWIRRPVGMYPFANRNDLRVGVVTAAQFVIAFDVRGGGQDFWLYPGISDGYAMQVVWDALVGRTDVEYADSDEVPFDEPVQSIVYSYVKSKLALEVDNDINASNTFERQYKQEIALLNMEVMERLRLKADVSQATCLPSVSCGTCQLEICNCSCANPILVDGYVDESGTITMPFTEWCMVGDSGDQAYIKDTIAVASAIRALNPEFVVHLGDCAYGTDKRPGEVGSSQSVGSSLGGSSHLLLDLFLKHYWSFKDSNLYLAFGNHDLEAQYGIPLLNALPTVRGLIGDSNITSKLYRYEFARGPVRFFVLNSGTGDADAFVQINSQKSWLLDRIAVAAEPWLVVVFHRPAQCSDEAQYPGSTLMKSLTDTLAAAGVDLVVNAHGHNYERFLDANGLTHVACGLGGAPKRNAAASISGLAGSQFFYNSKNAFLHFKADKESLQWSLVTVDGEIVDQVSLLKNENVLSGGGGGGGGGSTPYNVYFGKNTSTPINEAQVLALSPRSVVTNSGTYAFVDGPGYVYFAFPSSKPAPLAFMLTIFSVPMAGPDEGFTEVANGINYMTVTVNGEPHRVYRSYNEMAGTFDITVS